MEITSAQYLIDIFGNRIDKNGNILDEMGRPRTENGKPIVKKKPFLDDDGQPIQKNKEENIKETDKNQQLESSGQIEDSTGKTDD